ANTCTNSYTATVTSFPNPSVQIINPGPICGNLAQITIATDQPGGDFSGSYVNTNGILYPNMIPPGTFSVSYTIVDNNNCEGTDFENITIIAQPNAIATNNSPVCAGQLIQLTGSSNDTSSLISYLWSGPNGYTSNLQNPTDATLGGIYILKVSVAACSSAPDTTNVVVNGISDALAQNGGPYCNGEAIQLMASTSSTSSSIIYAWTGPNGYTSNIQNPSNATVGGSYSLVITVDGCASAVSQTDVLVGTPPDASAMNSGPYCAGEPIALFGNTTFAGNVISYGWSGPNGYLSTTQNPTDAAAPGTYTLIINVDGCNSLPVTTDVTIHTLSQPLITGQSVFCTGFSATIDAGPGYAQYTWSNASLSQTQTVMSPGTYIVTVTDINGCTGATSFDVTELASLAPVITGALDFCEGSGTTLNAGNGYASYLWSSGASSQTIAVTNTGSYSVTVIDQDGCSGSTLATTTVHALPVVTIGGSSTYCIGGYTILDAGTGYASYAWSNDSTSQTIKVSSPGIYSVDLVDNYGCTGSATILVDESTSLKPVITGAATYCKNESTTLNAGSGFAIYLWSDGSSGQTLDVNAPGMYAVTVTDVTGCSGSSSVSVIEVLPPDAGIAMAPLSYCLLDNDLVNLSTLIIGADPNGTWNETSVQLSQGGAFNPVNGTFATLNQTPGDYAFQYALASSMVCPGDTTEVHVVINQLPVAMIQAVNDLNCADPKQSLDANASSSGPEYTIIWSGPGILVDGNENTLHPMIDKAGIYKLSITNTLTGCSNADSVAVGIAAGPTDALINIQPPSCFGEKDASIIIAQVTGGMPPYVYSLNNTSLVSLSSFQQLSAGTYFLSLEDVNGCKWDTLISFDDPPAINVDLGPDIEIGLGDNAIVQAIVNLASNQIDTMIWSPDDIISCIDLSCLEAIVHPFNTITLHVTVVDLFGCEASDDLVITLNKNHNVYIPTAFSPNDDGINDVFMISGNEREIARIKKFAVFSRWGEVLHEVQDFLPNDPSKGWNGHFKNEILNPGVYVYYAEVEYVDGIVEWFHGDVTLMR
ncbi:MAG: gliding motility-associated C-terminal domain-containing protein, partial [Saprospiraceae bacterium]